MIHCPKPKCGGVTYAQGTLPGLEDIIVRYRVCQKCGHRFKTTQQKEEIPKEEKDTSYGVSYV